MPQDYENTIACSVHIESLNKIARYINLAHAKLEEVTNFIRADYADQFKTTGAALERVDAMVSQLLIIKKSWEDAKRNLYIEAASALLPDTETVTQEELIPAAEDAELSEDSALSESQDSQ